MVSEVVDDRMVEPVAGERDRPGAGLTWGQVIGLPVIAGDMPGVVTEILRRAARGETGYVCVANVHMLVTARMERDFRPVLDGAALVVSDGRPLVWRLRNRGWTQAQHIYGPTLMVELCRKAAADGVPVFFYGGDDAQRDALVAQLHERFPGIRIAGAEPAPMLPRKPAVDPALVERIRASGAKLVFCALGCPKQEFWMQAHAPHLPAMLVGVGQAFGIVAGTLPDAPDWMRERGLGWLFRLKTEPGRLWKRYFVTNSLFIAMLAGETLTGAARRRRADAGS